MTRRMISVDEAWAIIDTYSLKTGTEIVPLRQAAGRVLAEPLIAKVTQPPLSVSAMDGYAVSFRDVEKGSATLRVIGEAPAGRPFYGMVRSGEAVRIFTGGAVPDGADHIVIQEHAQRDSDSVYITDPESGPGHVRRAGIDFKSGEVLLAEGVELKPSAIAVAAAANFAELSVYRRPRVALIANGDELKPPGSVLGPGEIVASNGYGLSALIERWSGEAVDLGIAPDDPDVIASIIAACEGVDIILPIGGASVGDHDHMRAVFNARGLEMIFEKVAVKPGKPTWFGRLGESVVLGLPGNPASAWVCAHLFLKPLIGMEALSSSPASLTKDIAANGPRETYMRGRVEQGSVTPAPNQDSSLLTPLLHSNVLIRRRPGAEPAKAGDLVDVLPLD